MQSPTTTYRHGCTRGRRGNNTSVSPHCLTAHPVMGGEKRHCTHLTSHCTSLVTLEGRYDKVRTPRFQGFGLIRSASTRPRPSLDPQHSVTGKEGRYGTTLRVISTPRPLRHHVPKDGLPFLRHVATVTSTEIDKTSSQGSRRPGLFSSYKRVGQGSGEDNGRPVIHKIAINISSNHLVLFLFLP
jgi:hypothetical protein